MAAVDKLYVHSYEEYEKVRLWSMVYYPKLLLWFYNISLTHDEFVKSWKEWIEYRRQKFGDEYTFPIMNTPCNIDRKLKWICPLPCVREYLHKQCGVNPKWEWLYRIFWRGKKHF